MWGLFQNHYNNLTVRYPRHTKIIRFLIAGTLATGTNLGVLYILTDWFELWYLLSAVLSFIVAFFISFTLQKFWTFGDRSREAVPVQAGAFLVVALVGLGINTLGLYGLVDYIGLHYLMAQIIMSVFIAAANFFMYQFVIFKKTV